MISSAHDVSQPLVQLPREEERGTLEERLVRLLQYLHCHDEHVHQAWLRVLIKPTPRQDKQELQHRVSVLAQTQCRTSNRPALFVCPVYGDDKHSRHVLYYLVMVVCLPGDKRPRQIHFWAPQSYDLLAWEYRGEKCTRKCKGGFVPAPKDVVNTYASFPCPHCCWGWVQEAPQFPLAKYTALLLDQGDADAIRPSDTAQDDLDPAAHLESFTRLNLSPRGSRQEDRADDAMQQEADGALMQVDAHANGHSPACSSSAIASSRFVDAIHNGNKEIKLSEQRPHPEEGQEEPREKDARPHTQTEQRQLAQTDFESQREQQADLEPRTVAPVLVRKRKRKHCALSPMVGAPVRRSLRGLGSTMAKFRGSTCRRSSRLVKKHRSSGIV